MTSDRGVNVCETNKTTDYYQADEAWWTQTWEDGEPWHSGLKFDESADLMGVSIHLAVRDPEGGELLGIAKAVLEQPIRRPTP